MCRPSSEFQMYFNPVCRPSSEFQMYFKPVMRRDFYLEGGGGGGAYCRELLSPIIL